MTSHLTRIYYMRDNHTFLQLPLDVGAAIAELKREFEEGNTYGMLCCSNETARTPTLANNLSPVHAGPKSKWLDFEQKARPWLTEAVAKLTKPEPAKKIPAKKTAVPAITVLRELYESHQSRQGWPESVLSDVVPAGLPNAGDYRLSRLQDDWELWQGACFSFTCHLNSTDTPFIPSLSGWLLINVVTPPSNTEVLIGAFVDGVFKWGRSQKFYEQGNAFEGEDYSGWVWSIDDCDDSVAENPTYWMPSPVAPTES